MNLMKHAPSTDFGGKPGAVLGIRPEHLEVTETGWPVHIETIEMLGAERLLYGRLGQGSDGEQLIVRTDESDACPALGATIYVTPKRERLHWFDAGTTRRID